MRRELESTDVRPVEPPRPRRLPVWTPGWAQGFAVGEPIDVSVCIANWNCKELLRGCLRSLLELPQGVSVEVIVVDNASADGSPDLIAEEFPEVTLIRNAENRGFSTANNQVRGTASRPTSTCRKWVPRCADSPQPRVPPCGSDRPR